MTGSLTLVSSALVPHESSSNVIYSTTNFPLQWLEIASSLDDAVKYLRPLLKPMTWKIFTVLWLMCGLFSVVYCDGEIVAFCMKVGTKRPEHPPYGERSRHGWAKRRLRGRNNSRKRRWTSHLPPHAMSAFCPEETSTTRDAISFCAPISLSRK